MHPDFATSHELTERDPNTGDDHDEEVPPQPNPSELSRPGFGAPWVGPWRGRTEPIQSIVGRNPFRQTLTPGAAYGDPSTFTVPVDQQSHSPQDQPEVDHAISESLISSLEDVIEKFRCGESSKSGVLLSLFSRITKAKLPADIQRLTLEQWTETIDRTAAILTGNETRGLHARFFGGSPRIPRAQQGQREPPVDGQPGCKQRFNDAELEDGDNNDDDEDAYPKRKIDRTKLPWHHGDVASRDTSNPIVLANRELLRYYARNIAAVKQDAILSPSAPEGIPPSEFENALRGQPINLDNILSSLNHIRPPQENVGRIGTTEIRFDANKPALLGQPLNYLLKA